MVRINILDILKHSAMFDSKEFSEDRDIISLQLALQCIKDNFEISSARLKEQLNNIFSENYSDTILTLLKDRYSTYCNISTYKCTLTFEGSQLVEAYLKKTDEQDKKLFSILLQYIPETNRGTIVNKYLSFLIKPFTEANHQIKWDGYIKLNDEDCLHFIEMIDDIYITQKEYINIIANTMYGITSIYSYHTQPSKQTEKQENIFLDDMFIENLFGWQAPWYCEPTHSLFKLFKETGYKMKIYTHTLDIIMHTLLNFHTFPKLKIAYETMYFYMNSCIDQKEKNTIDPSKILSRDTLDWYVRDHLGIIIEKFPSDTEADTASELYQNIVETRKNQKLYNSYRGIVDFNSDRGEFTKKLYDEYHYKIIFHFGSSSNTVTRKHKRKVYLTYKTQILLQPFSMYSKNNNNNRIPSICSPSVFAIDLFLKQILHHRNDSIDNIQFYLLDILDLYYAESKMPLEISENIRESIQKYPPEEQHQILDRFAESSEDRKLIRDAKGNIPEYLKNRENTIQEKDETILTVNSQLSDAIDTLQDYTKILGQKNDKQIENTLLEKKKKTPKQYLSDTRKDVLKFNKKVWGGSLFIVLLVSVVFTYIFFKKSSFYTTYTTIIQGVCGFLLSSFLFTIFKFVDKNNQLIFQFREEIEEKMVRNQANIMGYDKELENLKKKTENIEKIKKDNDTP